jgi:hypothetical protein
MDLKAREFYYRLSTAEAMPRAMPGLMFLIMPELSAQARRMADALLWIELQP